MNEEEFHQLITDWMQLDEILQNELPSLTWKVCQIELVKTV